jgi:hypothetical protein
MELPPYSTSVSDSAGSAAVALSARTLNIDTNASYTIPLLFVRINQTELALGLIHG